MPNSAHRTYTEISRSVTTARQISISKMKRSQLVKIISVAITILFLHQQIVWAQGGEPLWGGMARRHQHRRNEKLENVDMDIPYGIGRMKEVSIEGENDDIIIHIQDSHASLSAQYSIVEILNTLVKDYDLSLITLEGAQGYLDASILQAIPDRKIRRDTADFLMRDGRLSAAEFFTVMRDQGDIPLYGIEDNELYRKNIESFCSVAEERARLVGNVNKFIEQLKSLESRTCSNELRILNDNAWAHRLGEKSFTEYWKEVGELARKSGIDTGEYAELKKLLKTIEMEKKIDFIEANIERRKLMEVLSGSLNKTELEELVLESVKFNEGRISGAEFHNYLAALAEDHRIDREGFENLVLYTEYISLYETIEIFGLFREVGLLEEAIREKLYRNSDERQLYEIMIMTYMLKRLYSMELTNEDAGLIRNYRGQYRADKYIGFIKEKCHKYDVRVEGGFDVSEMFSGIDEALGFYDIAESRNRVMIANTVKWMRSEGRRVSALVTGGYHTSGLTKLMKEKGLSYLVVVPKFAEDVERPYIAILTNKKKPYQKLLAADKYQLAVEAYFHSAGGNLNEFKEGIFFALGAAVLGGEKDLDGLKKLWIEAYRVKYGELQGDRKRLDAMSSEPVDPEDLSDMLNTARIEKIGATALIVYRGKAVMAIEEEGGIYKPAEVTGKHRRIIDGRMATEADEETAPAGFTAEDSDAGEIPGRIGEEELRSEELTDLVVARLEGRWDVEYEDIIRILMSQGLPPDWENDPELAKEVDAFIIRCHFSFNDRRGISIEELEEELRSEEGRGIGGKTVVSGEEIEDKRAAEEKPEDRSGVDESWEKGGGPIAALMVLLGGLGLIITGCVVVGLMPTLIGFFALTGIGMITLRFTGRVTGHFDSVRSHPFLNRIVYKAGYLHIALVFLILALFLGPLYLQKPVPPPAVVSVAEEEEQVLMGLFKDPLRVQEELEEMRKNRERKFLEYENMLRSGFEQYFEAMSETAHFKSIKKNLSPGEDELMLRSHFEKGNVLRLDDRKNQGMPERRVERLNKIVDDIWEGMDKDALPDYMKSKVDEYGFGIEELQKALFVLKVLDPEAYRYSEKWNVRAVIVETNWFDGATSGDRFLGLVSKNLRGAKISIKKGRGAVASAWIFRHEMEHHKEFPTSLWQAFKSILCWIQEIPGMLFDRVPSYERNSFRAQRQFMRKIHIDADLTNLYQSYLSQRQLFSLMSIGAWLGILIGPLYLVDRKFRISERFERIFERLDETFFKDPDRRFKKEPEGMTSFVAAVAGIALAIFNIITFTIALAGITGIFSIYLIYKYGVLHSALRSKGPMRDKQFLQNRCVSILGLSYKDKVQIVEGTDWDGVKSPYAYTGNGMIYVREKVANGPIAALALVLMHEKAEGHLNKAPPSLKKEIFANFGEFLFTLTYILSGREDTFYIYEHLPSLVDTLQEEGLDREKILNDEDKECLDNLYDTEKSNPIREQQLYDYLTRMLTLRRNGMPFDSLYQLKEDEEKRNLLQKMGSQVLKKKMELLAKHNLPVIPELFFDEELVGKIELLEEHGARVSEGMLKLVTPDSLEVYELRRSGALATYRVSSSDRNFDKELEEMARKVELFKYAGLSMNPRVLGREYKSIVDTIRFLDNYGLDVNDDTAQYGLRGCLTNAVIGHSAIMAEPEMSDEEVWELARFFYDKFLIPEEKKYEGVPLLASKHSRELMELDEFSEVIKRIYGFNKLKTREAKDRELFDLSDYLENNVFSGAYSEHFEDLSSEDSVRLYELYDKFTAGAEEKENSAEYLRRAVETITDLRTSEFSADRAIVQALDIDSLIAKAVSDHIDQQWGIDAQKALDRVYTLLEKAEDSHRKNVEANDEAFKAVTQYVINPSRQNLQILREIGKREQYNPIYRENLRTFDSRTDEFILRAMNVEAASDVSGKFDKKFTRERLGKEGLKDFRLVLKAFRTLFPEALPYTRVLSKSAYIVENTANSRSGRFMANLLDIKRSKPRKFILLICAVIIMILIPVAIAHCIGSLQNLHTGRPVSDIGIAPAGTALLPDLSTINVPVVLPPSISPAARGEEAARPEILTGSAGLTGGFDARFNAPAAMFAMDTADQELSAIEDDVMRAELYPSGRIRSIEYFMDTDDIPRGTILHYSDDPVQNVGNKTFLDPRFLKGFNLPWAKGYYGYNVGLGTLGGQRGQHFGGFSNPSVRQDLIRRMEERPLDYMRVFLFCDLRAGVQFDDAGNPIGFTDKVYEDMDVLVSEARSRGIKLMPVLVDFLIADGVSEEWGTQVGEHPDAITDPAKRVAFISLMGDFVEHYRGEDTIWAWDLFNEPEWIVGKAPVSFAQLQTFVRELTREVHNRCPGTMVTLGSATRDHLLRYWTDKALGVAPQDGLDLYQFHFHNWMSGPNRLNYPYADMRVDKPVIVGEIEPDNLREKLRVVCGGGYLGGFPWEDHNYTISERFWEDRISDVGEKIEHGFLVRQDNPDGSYWTFSDHYPDGRPKFAREFDAGATEPKAVYEYDGANHLVKKTTSEAIYTYYPYSGRINTKEFLVPSGNIPAGTVFQYSDNDIRKEDGTRYGYVMKEIYPDGTRREYMRDPGSGKVEYIFEYDDNDRQILSYDAPLRDDEQGDYITYDWDQPQAGQVTILFFIGSYDIQPGDPVRYDVKSSEKVGLDIHDYRGDEIGPKRISIVYGEGGVQKELNYYYENDELQRHIDVGTGDITEYGTDALVSLIYDASESVYRTYDWAEETVTVTEYRGGYETRISDPVRVDVQADEKVEEKVYRHNGNKDPDESDTWEEVIEPETEPEEDAYPSGLLRRTVTDEGFVIEYEDNKCDGQDYGRAILMSYEEAGGDRYKTFEWDTGDNRDQVTVTEYGGRYEVSFGDKVLSDVQQRERISQITYDHKGEYRDLDAETNGWVMREKVVYDNGQEKEKYSYYENGEVQRHVDEHSNITEYDTGGIVSFRYDSDEQTYWTYEWDKLISGQVIMTEYKGIIGEGKKRYIYVYDHKNDRTNIDPEDINNTWRMRYKEVFARNGISVSKRFFYHYDRQGNEKGYKKYDFIDKDGSVKENVVSVSDFMTRTDGKIALFHKVDSTGEYWYKWGEKVPAEGFDKPHSDWFALYKRASEPDQWGDQWFIHPFDPDSDPLDPEWDQWKWVKTEPLSPGTKAMNSLPLTPSPLAKRGTWAGAKTGEIQPVQVGASSQAPPSGAGGTSKSATSRTKTRTAEPAVSGKWAQKKRSAVSTSFRRSSSRSIRQGSWGSIKRGSVGERYIDEKDTSTRRTSDKRKETRKSRSVRTDKDRRKASDDEDEEEKESESLLANLFHGRLSFLNWPIRVLVFASTVFHEAGHLICGLREQQQVKVYLLPGRVRGLSGAPAKYGGILGNVFGAFYFTILMLVMMRFRASFIPFTIIPVFGIFVNLFSILVEGTGLIFGIGDMAGVEGPEDADVILPDDEGPGKAGTRPDIVIYLTGGKRPEDTGGKETQSLLANLFAERFPWLNRFIRILAIGSTPAHELGHGNLAVMLGQGDGRASILDVLWQGRTMGISGSARKHGGLLGNALFIVILVFLFPAKGALGRYIHIYLIAINLISIFTEGIGYLFGRGDLAGEEYPDDPGAPPAGRRDPGSGDGQLDLKAVPVEETPRPGEREPGQRSYASRVIPVVLMAFICLLLSSAAFSSFASSRQYPAMVVVKADDRDSPSTVQGREMVKYEYYPSGRMKSKKVLVKTDDLLKGMIFYYSDEPVHNVGMAGEYGRLIRQVYPDGNYKIFSEYYSPDQWRYIDEYDKDGNWVAGYEYDANGNYIGNVEEPGVGRKPPVYEPDHKKGGAAGRIIRKEGEVYWKISSDFEYKKEKDGTQFTYNIVNGVRYPNTRVDPDGTFTEYHYNYNAPARPVLLGAEQRDPDRTTTLKLDSNMKVVDKITPDSKFYEGGNLPWIKYGYDVGMPTLSAQRGEHFGYSTPEGAKALVDRMREYQGDYMRIFIFCDMRAGIKFDKAGNPTGFTGMVYKDMDMLVMVAEMLGIRLMPILLDFHIANGVSEENGTLVGEHPDLIIDPVKRAAIVRLMADFARHYRNNRTIWAWDLFNEPEEVEKAGTATFAELQAFVREFLAAIRKADPDSEVTLGCRDIETLIEYWTNEALGMESGNGFTVYQPHYYEYMEKDGKGLDRQCPKLDKPVIMGEVEPAGNKASDERRKSLIRTRGYCGSLFWHTRRVVSGEREAQSLLANLFTGRLSFLNWIIRVPVIVSTPFHELGHLLAGLWDNQTPKWRWYDLLFTGNVRGLRGYPAAIGGVVGNIFGMLIWGVLSVHLPFKPLSDVCLIFVAVNALSGFVEIIGAEAFSRGDFLLEEKILRRYLEREAPDELDMREFSEKYRLSLDKVREVVAAIMIGENSKYLELINPETGQRTGKAMDYDVAHEQGGWHGLSHVLAISPDGEIVVQVRGRGDMRRDMSVGGHVNMGEDWEQAALRELEEELKLEHIDRRRLIPTGKYKKIGREDLTEEEYDPDNRTYKGPSKKKYNREICGLFVCFLNEEEAKKLREEGKREAEDELDHVEFVRLDKEIEKMDKPGVKHASGFRQYFAFPEVREEVMEKIEEIKKDASPDKGRKTRSLLANIFTGRLSWMNWPLRVLAIGSTPFHELFHLLLAWGRGQRPSWRWYSFITGSKIERIRGVPSVWGGILGNLVGIGVFLELASRPGIVSLGSFVNYIFFFCAAINIISIITEAIGVRAKRGDLVEDRGRGDIKIALGIPWALYEELKIRDLEYKLQKRTGVDSFIPLRPSTREEMLEELYNKTRNGKVIAAIIDNDLIWKGGMLEDTGEINAEKLEIMMRDFARKIEKDVIRLMNPEVAAMNEETVRMIMESRKFREVVNVYARLLPEADSLGLADKSIFDFRLVSINEEILSKFEQTNNVKRFIRMVKHHETGKYVSVSARNLADMKFIASAMHNMYFSKNAASKFLQVRILDKNVTEENLDRYMKNTGLDKYLERSNVVLASSEDMSLEEIIEKVKETFGDAENDRIAVGATRDLVRSDADRALLKAGKAPIYVEMQEESGEEDGIASQLLYALIEVMCNDGKIPEALGRLIVMKGYKNWFIFLPNMEMVDVEALRKEMENYEEVLTRA